MEGNENLSLKRVTTVWWPLAASWLLMGVELPLLTAVVERMANPDINLASFGSIVLPLSLLIESPIIMLLAAATALVRDRQSYARLQSFTTASAIALTVLHVVVAFGPSFDWLCMDLLEVPRELLEPARRGMQIMTPWTWAIAYRRMQHGVLIRAGHSRAVGVGTLVRLGANVFAMVLAGNMTSWSGIVIGTIGISVGVTCEAIFAGILVRPIVRDLPEGDPTQDHILPWKRLFKFYAPLAMTPLITLILPLVGSAAMSRMPNPMLSLAAWPAVHGLVFLFRGVGMSYNEVVVALIHEPGSIPVLRQFTWRVAAGTMALLALVVLTPLSSLWFTQVMHLSPEVARVTRLATGFALLMPAYQVAQSWYQGVLVASGKTRAIPEAVALYSCLAGVICLAGVRYTTVTGIYYTVLAFTCGGIVQTVWLWHRSKQAIRQFSEPALLAKQSQPDALDPSA
ncbi:MAG: hypothetical protein ACI9F9_000438 [Candidatus Paceibacteria bacterium]|jgi:hypothetical protein